MAEGKLIIFSSPSGAGKTTIVRHLLSKYKSIQFSISATTRAMRQGETDGKDYYFLSHDAFQKEVDANGFVEWEEVYPGLRYGTLKKELERIWENGNHAIFDVDVEGAINIKKQYGEKAMTVFVRPPSIQALEQRLINRGTDDTQSLRTRLEKAELEISYENQFDEVIVNDILEKALVQAEKLVSTFLKF